MMLLHDTHKLRQPGPLGKALALIGGAVLLILGFMFSLVLLVIAAVAVAIAGAYLWRKTRELSRQLRETAAQRQAPAPEGSVFEGEAIRVDEAEHRPADR